MPTLPANWKLHFGALFAGQAVSLFGSGLVQFALVWYLTQTTGSATVLATATLAATLPGIVLGPPAGVLVDRWNRRWVMFAADGLVALATLALAYLFWVGVAQPWHVYVIMFIRSAGQTFQSPALQASTSLMVPREHLARVAGFNQMLQGGLGILAPPIGALLLALLPLQGVLAIDFITALVGLSPLLFVRIPQPAAVASAERGSFGGELRAGLRYVAVWPGMLLLLSMALVLNLLFTPASALLPLLVRNHFGGGAPQLAALESTFGIGVIAGSLLLGVWGGFKRRIFTSLLGLVGLGLGFFLIGAAPANAFWFAVAAMGLAAVMQPITNGPLMAILQATVAPEMQGRVFALVGAGATAMTPLGLLLAGPAADWLGVQFWFLLSGAVCVVMALGAFFMPALLNIERHAPTAAPAANTAASETASAAG
ncbi:MAG: MFS transporter [Anaerolineales bacterium]|nr:MFS transporter [Anaerolineales bacterium]